MFSVVVTTRNRPVLLRRALASILGQQDAAFDVVVVNDGTSGTHRPALDALRADLAAEPRVRILDLPETPSGHGPYSALNAGVRAATAAYVAFLDDDDVWTDPTYLATAARIIGAGPTPPDLLFFDQSAVNEAGPVDGPIWLEDLGARLRSAGAPDVPPAYTVDVATLLTAHGFCHVNSMITRRAFLDGIGGFDDRLRYEGDRDVFLRAIDAAADIRYAPHIVARHHIPVAQAVSNISTRVPQTDRRLDQFALLDKAARSARHPGLVAYGRMHRRYALVRAAQAAVAARRPGQLVRCLLRAPRLLF